MVKADPAGALAAGAQPAWLLHTRIPERLLDPATRARLPVAAPGLRRAHLCIEGGRVRAIEACAPVDAGAAIDLRDGVVTSAWVEVHTHLDKSQTGPRLAHNGNSLQQAIACSAADRATWTASDLRRRMDFSLRTAHAHGTRAVRTHLDWVRGDAPLAWRVAQDLRDAWSGRIALQLSSICPLPLFADAAAGAQVARTLAAGAGILGASVHPVPNQRLLLERVFELAVRYDLNLDFHVDEHLLDDTAGMQTIADLTLHHRWAGRVVCGHCCALAVAPPARVHSLLQDFVRAGIHLVSLPLANLQLQDRQAGAMSRTPRTRGIAPVREAVALGVPVSIASDNVRDPFVPYADFDLLHVLAITALAAHLPDPLVHWIDSITSRPARAMGLAWDGALHPGCPADLVLLQGRDSDELCSRPQAPRQVLRAGRLIDTALPDFRELDA